MNERSEQNDVIPDSGSSHCYPFSFDEVKHLTHQDAKRRAGCEVYICRRIGVYEGPVTLERLTKAGHGLVLSDFPLTEPQEPTNYLNHRQGGKYRSTVMTYRLAEKRCG